MLRIATNSENVLRPKLGRDLPMAGRSPQLRTNNKETRPWARCRSALEPGSLYPRPRTATRRVATSSVLKLAQVLPMAADATPRRKAGAERHSKIGFYSAKTAGVGFFPKIVTIRTPRAFLALLQTAPNGRASRRHPLRREVPLGTRKLEFAQTSPRAATRFWTKTASGHHISQPNELWPRAWGKFFRFNSSLKRGISLLRRGARVELSRRA